jgi:hypothetical protein
MLVLRKLVLALVLVWLEQELPAATWADAKEAMFPSADGRYLFHVVPRVHALGRLRREPQAPDDGVPSLYGSLEVCFGTLLRFENGYYQPVWRAKLINAVAPNWVIPSHDGEAVVTLGNWANQGNEDHLIAVYGAAGKLLRKLKIEDIYSKEEIARLLESSAGIHWSGATRIDAKKNLFVMELPTVGRELRIDLRSGATIKAVE